MSNLTNSKLLIIDDESELREVLVALLEEVTTNITQAANGQEAIDLLSKNQFDAILSDEKMPKKGGIEVLKWCRANGLSIPFVIHTGYGQKDMVQEAERLGAFAFIDKPWDESKLIDTISRALAAGVAQKKNDV